MIKEFYKLVKAKLNDRRSKISTSGFFEVNATLCDAMGKALESEDRASYEKAFNENYLNLIAQANHTQHVYQTILDLIKSYKERGENPEAIRLLEEYAIGLNNGSAFYKVQSQILEKRLSPAVLFGGREQ